MKNIFILAVLILIGLTAKAQKSYPCHYKNYCEWNEITHEYGNCQGYDESSMFVMNKEETMFTHTVDNIISTYYIQSKSYDKENKISTYNVVSDAGKKYIYTFNSMTYKIEVILPDDKSVLVTFYTKASF